eukprot:2921444-Amphidinium_carterae.2
MPSSRVYLAVHSDSWGYAAQSLGLACASATCLNNVHILPNLHHNNDGAGNLRCVSVAFIAPACQGHGPGEQHRF